MTGDERQMWQVAPYPHELVEVVDGVVFRDWAMNISNYERPGECEGLTFRVRIPADDVHVPDTHRFWVHEFDVPARVADRETWSHWVFDCLMLAMRHEAMEEFMIDGVRVFEPAHDLVKDMYAVRHRRRLVQIGGVFDREAELGV